MNAVTRSQAVLVSAHAARLVISIAIASLLGRSLSAADFGFVALVSILYVVAVELLDMGTTAAATREIAARPARERETLTALLALRRLVAAALMGALLLLACTDFADRDAQRLVLVAAAIGAFLLHLHAYQLVFQLRQAYRPVTNLTLAAQLGFLAACFAALKLHAGGAVIALLVVAREAVQALGSRFLAIRMLGDKLRASWSEPGMGALLKAGWMLGVAGVAYKLCAYAGSFILWEVASAEALASFNAAQRLLTPLSDAAWLFAAPLIAAMSGTVAHDPPALRVQIDGYVKLMLSMSCLVAVGGYFVAPLVLRILYGDIYASGPWSAVVPFRWLALGYLFALVSPVLVVGEMVRGHARALLVTAFACLALTLAGNAWAIPRHGAEGAAMVLAASEALLFSVVFVRAIARGDVDLGPAWIVYLLPAALLAAILWLLAESPILQLVAACAWAPISLLVVMRLPAQRASRASLPAPTAGGAT